MEVTQRCFYFGCWNSAGHHIRAAPGQEQHWRNHKLVEYYSGGIHLDGTLAPMVKPYGKGIDFIGRIRDKDERFRASRWEECPQGQFLRHYLDSGFTALQWWDRCQGDSRGACNSTILLEGDRTSKECIEALRQHFPSVLDNLTRHGIELVEVLL